MLLEVSIVIGPLERIFVAPIPTSGQVVEGVAATPEIEIPPVPVA